MRPHHTDSSGAVAGFIYTSPTSGKAKPSANTCQRYASTRFEEQRQLNLPQKHKATVPDSTLRVEMSGLEEQADNAQARDLYWMPL